MIGGLLEFFFMKCLLVSTVMYSNVHHHYPTFYIVCDMSKDYNV